MITSKINNKKFEDNFDAIFKEKKPSKRGRYIQDPSTGKLVHSDDFVPSERDVAAPFVFGNFDSFVSPIDGRTVDSREGLRKHNKIHGVTNTADYSETYLAKQRSDNTPSKKEIKQERQQTILTAMRQHGIR